MGRRLIKCNANTTASAHAPAGFEALLDGRRIPLPFSPFFHFDAYATMLRIAPRYWSRAGQRRAHCASILHRLALRSPSSSAFQTSESSREQHSHMLRAICRQPRVSAMPRAAHAAPPPLDGILMRAAPASAFPGIIYFCRSPLFTIPSRSAGHDIIHAHYYTSSARAAHISPPICTPHEAAIGARCFCVPRSLGRRRDQRSMIAAIFRCIAHAQTPARRFMRAMRARRPPPFRAACCFVQAPRLGQLSQLHIFLPLMYSQADGLP